MATADARGLKPVPLYYEDHGFSPDPPTPDEVEFDARVGQIVVQFDLRYCRDAADAAWRLSHALAALEKLALNDRKLSRFAASDAQRNRLCKAVVIAMCDAGAKLPQSFDRERLACGMKATYALAYSLLEPSEQRLSDHPDARPDARDHMRRLRNALHDFNLAADIERRRRERARVVAIDRFRAGAKTSGEA